MLHVRNETPFAVGTLPSLDKEGRESLTIVVKATYAILGDTLGPASAGVPIFATDRYAAEPGRSALLHEADVAPEKVGTDVVVHGHAYAAGAPATSLDVELRVGPIAHRVRVVGDRVWVRAAGSWISSDPVAFARMPLGYERAFGGRSVALAYEANPLGRGYLRGAPNDAIEGSPLPNLERPGALVGSPRDEPAPAGFGFVPRGWPARLVHAGTYDQRWRAERSPLLPLDFDPRYFNAAPEGLVAVPGLRGGEAFTMTHGRKDGGTLAFTVPEADLEVTARIRGADTTFTPRLDTLIVEPDEGRVVLVHRVAIPTGRRLLHVEHVRVRERDRRAA